MAKAKNKESNEKDEKVQGALSKQDKKRALEAVINSAKKKWGEESIVSLSGDNVKTYDVISTGSVLLDDCIGIGGLPRGRIVEIYGPESSGKTTLTDIICGIAQKLYPDDYVAIIDVEHAKDPNYSKTLGLDLEKTLIYQPSSGEEALDLVREMVSSGACSVVVLDSVAALSTKRQIDGEVGDATIGEVARLMSNEMKKIASSASKTNTLVIFINQIRMKIGVMYGNPETTTGGNSLKFYASVRLDIRKKDVINKDDPQGQVVGIKVIKNKVGRPFGSIETNLYFGKGFNKAEELAVLAIEKGFVERGGAWYNVLPGTPLEQRFQGKERVIEYISENEEVYNAVHAQVFSNIVPVVVDEPITEDIPESEVADEEV